MPPEDGRAPADYGGATRKAGQDFERAASLDQAAADGADPAPFSGEVITVAEVRESVDATRADLQKAVESLARLHADDRFLRNRVDLEQRHGSNAARAATLVQSIADDLGGTLRCQFCDGRIAVTASCCDRCGVCR